METQRQQRIQELQTLIARGEYAVDPTRIADAVVRCVSALALAHEDERATRAPRPPRRRIRGSLRSAASRCRRSSPGVVAAAR
jgi:hypothetical protein